MHLHTSQQCQSKSHETPIRTTHLANADTGTDGNYLCCMDIEYVTNLQPDTSRSVSLPDGSVIVSTQSGILIIPSLPLSARKCWIFNELTGSLLCPGDWCDAGATVTYTKSKVVVTGPTGDTILVGDRVHDMKLWMINLDQSDHPNVISTIITLGTCYAVNEWVLLHPLKSYY